VLNSQLKKSIMIKKIPTDCCALCQLSMSNEDGLDTIREYVAQLKKEALAQDYKGTDKTMGQRAAFVITTPNEALLESCLRDSGFKAVFVFNRRNGYEKGLLTMWTIHIEPTI
jgi:hypothetical protein